MKKIKIWGLLVKQRIDGVKNKPIWGIL